MVRGVECTAIVIININLPFGDGLYQLFIMTFGVVYYCYTLISSNFCQFPALDECFVSLKKPRSTGRSHFSFAAPLTAETIEKPKKKHIETTRVYDHLFCTSAQCFTSVADLHSPKRSFSIP